jgi:hypothetical protein
LSRGLDQSRKRRVVLPRCLTDRGTYHELEDLILAQTRSPRHGDVLVGDRVGVLGDLVDPGFQRLGEPCVVESGAALGVRRPAISLEDPRDERFAQLRDIAFPELYAAEARIANASRSPVQPCSESKIPRIWAAFPP